MISPKTLLLLSSLSVGLVGCTSVSRETHSFAGNLAGFMNCNGIARRQFKAVLEIDKVVHPDNVLGDSETVGWYDGHLSRTDDLMNDHNEALAYYQKRKDIFREKYCQILLSMDYLNLENSPDHAVEAAESARSFFHSYGTLGAQWNEGDALIALGSIYDARNQYGKAIDCFEEAAYIFHNANGGRVRETDALNGLGNEFNKLGRPYKALESFRKSLNLQPFYLGTRFFPSVKVPDLSRLANGYYNAANACSALGQHELAIQFYKRALPNYMIFRGGMDTDLCLCQLGREYESLGDHYRALWCCKLVLAPWENPLKWKSAASRSLSGSVLCNLACTYESFGRHDKAVACYHQALSILQEVKDQPTEASSLDALMEYWKDHDKPDLAVFYGKKAVDDYQEIRGNIQGLDRELRRGYLTTHGKTYRALADLLITRGRLPEAEQVLNMLKEDEFFDYEGRETSQGSPLAARIEMTACEASWDSSYRGIADRIASLGTQRRTLRDKKPRTAAEDREMADVERDLEVASLEFQKQLDQITNEAGNSKGTEPDSAGLKEDGDLMRILGKLGPRTAAIYTLVGADEYCVILITANSRMAGRYPIKAADLNRKITEFRNVLQDSQSDPRPLAQELYRILVGPIERGLDDARAETLMWSLDGALRYVPIATLHDGRQYMVKRYLNVVFTPDSQSRLNETVSAHWTKLALGVSNEIGEFPALPHVAAELQGVFGGGIASFNDAVLQGNLLLDGRFNRQRMLAKLAEGPTLVHIASHFSFNPGNEADSFLLLGDGSRLTLGEIKSYPQVFAGVELLTLSACNTATGAEDADGKEIDGFGMLFQRKGAKAVMASLWRVADDSTEQLMSKFYRMREARPEEGKAEALRLAQIGLLDPKASMADSRRIRPEIDENHDAAGYQSDSPAPFAHPYFWAPFILIGNWK